MPYDDGAQTTVLYTKGTKGDDISEELRQFLSYMENTTQTNAVNDTLKDIQKMVDIVKRDGEVSLSYMKGFERDTIMYEKGQAAERKNTERERQRADSAEKEKIEALEYSILFPAFTFFLNVFHLPFGDKFIIRFKAVNSVQCIG